MLGNWQKTGIFLLAWLGTLAVSYGQTGNIPPVVSLNATNEPLREVLNRVEQQTGLSFSYSNRILDEEAPVTLHVRELSLKNVLDLLFDEEHLTYELVEKQIVVKRTRRLKFGISATQDGISDDEIPVRFTVSGYVKDAFTGEMLIGATVSIPGGVQGTITNNYGFFSLTLLRRAEELVCSYVGYRKQVIPVQGTQNQTFQFAMEKEAARISEVTVFSDDAATVIRTARSSEERIRPESVRRMPALFGEKDVIKSLATIPGISFFGDGSTIFYVRGGGRDQNLITIDEAPVYNPAHLLGFFSTVVPDAVKDVKVYKGDFPANYGGRLSSLIDIRTKDGNMRRFGMDGSAGLLSSRLSLEGPLWKEHISFFLAGRRSYITRPLQRFNPQLTDLHFSDLHLKLNYHINSHNRIFLSIYNGVDNYENTAGNDIRSGINWQNATATLRWNHLFSDRLFSNLTLLGSRYDYYLNTDIDAGNFWNSHIDNLSLKYDFTWYLLPGYTLRFGALAAGHFHNPGNYYRDHTEFDPGLDLSTKRTRELALYASNQFIINESLSIRVGLRLTDWQNVGPSTEYTIETTTGTDFAQDSLVISEYAEDNVYHQYFSLDPRVSILYRPGGNHLLKGSYSRTSQFQYLITNSISPFTSLEVWLPAGPNVKPQVAHQFTVGYTYRFGASGVRFDAEGYYKIMNNLIDYRDHARMLMNPLVEFELRFGTGRAFGMELTLEKETGKFNGWISYTWSRSRYTINGINNGEPYPAYSDRPHDFSLYLSWQFLPRVTLTGNFIYMTGAPFTTPTGFYYYDNHQVPIYAHRNNDRLPVYHRLDVALNWLLNKPGNKFRHELIFSVYNLYDRKNPVALHFNKTDNGDGTYVVPYNFYEDPTLEPTQFYLYGAVPSVSYHFTF